MSTRATTADAAELAVHLDRIIREGESVLNESDKRLFRFFVRRFYSAWTAIDRIKKDDGRDVADMFRDMMD